MPVPACLRLADDVLPRVRAQAARLLAGQGWSQMQVAQALGVSQAMVSKYAARQADDDPLVARLAAQLAHDAADNTPPTGPSSWCATLTIGESRPGADDALADLLAAEGRLREANPLHIMPQVGLNIARAIAGAVDTSDVLAYPARIVATDAHILAPMPPAWGASQHLAACLLALREADPTLHAIANIRGGSTARAGTANAVEMAREGDRVRRFREAVSAARRTPRLVHDPGAHGIEPCLYVAGPSAAAVVDEILRIAGKVKA